jgi:hypothetical protein
MHPKYNKDCPTNGQPQGIAPTIGQPQGIAPTIGQPQGIAPLLIRCVFLNSLYSIFWFFHPTHV